MGTVSSDAELASLAREVLTDSLSDDDPAVRLRAAKETFAMVDQSIVNGPFAHLTNSELLAKAEQLHQEAKELIHG